MGGAWEVDKPGKSNIDADGLSRNVFSYKEQEDLEEIPPSWHQSTLQNREYSKVCTAAGSVTWSHTWMLRISNQTGHWFSWAIELPRHKKCSGRWSCHFLSETGCVERTAVIIGQRQRSWSESFTERRIQTCSMERTIILGGKETTKQRVSTACFTTEVLAHSTSWWNWTSGSREGHFVNKRLFLLAKDIKLNWPICEELQIMYLL